MIFFIHQLTFFFFSVAFTASSDVGEGPYFGNGFRNGWVDQHSVRLWSRLTTLPDLNESGIHFLELPRSEHQELRSQADVDRIHRAQIPDGYQLDEMHASCPGMAGEIQVEYWSELDADDRAIVPWQSVEENRNYTLQWHLDGLQANTIYQVKMLARRLTSKELTDSIMGKFKTPPNPNASEEIKFSIVTGHDYNRRDDHDNGHQIYHSMLAEDLDFYVHTGDIEYYDKPNPWAMSEQLMYFKWNRLFALPYQREFYRQTTSYFLKDDHDALSNDCYPGMNYGAVSFDRGLEIFDQIQFPSNDKLYKRVRWGRDLEIWLVEGRNFRSPNDQPDGPGKSIWGSNQKEWVFRTMKDSDATFKVLITSTPILGPDRSNKNDNYANSGFKYEGEQIRDFLNQFENVFICTGDRHWQYVSHQQGTNLWEFSCGPGSDQHAGGWKEENRMETHQFLRVKGGYLTGLVHREKGIPTIRFKHHDVMGRVVHEEIFTRP